MTNGKSICMLSGPMTGVAELNRPAFNFRAQELKDNGYIILNPASLPDGLEHEQYMTVCYSLIDICDVVYFMYGWQYSKGARKEFDYACQKGKRLLFEEQGYYAYFMDTERMGEE